MPSELFLGDNDALSKQERIEPANHMLELWQAFNDLPSGPEGAGDRILTSPRSDDLKINLKNFKSMETLTG